MPATPASLPLPRLSVEQNSAFMRRIIATWWPLAASWMLMGAELPIVSAFVARLANPEINLAAYGGIVMPLAFIIESPIIMLLSASTALSKDWASFARMRRFMMGASAFLTALHVLVVFTPLYDFIATSLLGAPAEIIEPGRLGLRIMLPWTWSIAYRRFHQGVLIRFGRAGTVGRGTIIRLCANCTVLAAGFLIGSLPGIVVAASAVTTGVLCEAIYVALAVRPVLSGPLRHSQPVEPLLTWNAFFAFYFPLVMTSLIGLLASPINSAALGRMPRTLESLAAWPALSGLVFFLRSLGVAYNEVVVSMLDEPYSSGPLRRFALWLLTLTTALVVLITVTPLSTLWFGKISALEPELASLARAGLWFALPLPAMSVLQSWFQGAILYGKHTRGLTESVVVYLLIDGIILLAGVAWGKTTGFYVGWLALMIATLAQAAWLWLRSRSIMREIALRDQGTGANG
jgi:progressive ankylosis protein